VDILAPALRRLSLGGTVESVQSWPMPEKIGWVVERRERPGFVAGLQTGFHELLSLDPPTWRRIASPPEPHLPNNRLNDALVDHQGRIWGGTMDCDCKVEAGSLYRMDPDFTVSRHDTGYIVTNGPALSPDHNVLYHNDTARGLVYRLTLTPEGELRDKAEFIKFPSEWGFPDGMTVDASGGLWIAHWGGGRLSRFEPDGRLDRVIHLPTTQITNCVFAGPALDRLFVTSAADGRPDEPLAGSLFEVDAAGHRGLAPYLFAG
jgi:sugar lactone lactonase YvrE